MVEFRVDMTSTWANIYEGPIFYYKAKQTCTDSGSHIWSSTAKSEPSIGAISPVVDLYGRQKALWKSRPVDISQWRQWTCIVI